MNCDDIQKIIYVYEESSREEQVLVDHHIATCDACYSLLQTTRDQRIELRNIHAGIELEYPQVFTNQVMSRIRNKNQSVFNTLTFPFHLWIRNSFAAASLLLIIFFIAEVNHQPKQRQTQIIASEKEVVLNSSAFLNNLKSTPSSFSSLISCLKACEEGDTSTDCKACLDKINKKKSL